MLKKTQHDLLSSAPGPGDCRQPLPLKLDPWRRKHQNLRRTWAHCNSGVPSKERAGSNCSVCSTASVSLLCRLTDKSWGQQNVCPPVLSKVCRTKSHSITLDMDTLDRSCRAEAAVGFAPIGSPEKAAREGKPPHPASQQKMTKSGRPRPWPSTLRRATASRDNALVKLLRQDKNTNVPRRGLGAVATGHEELLSARRGSDCRGSPLPVTHLRRLPRMKSLRGRGAGVTT